MDEQTGKVGFRAFITGIFFAAFFAWLTVYFSERHEILVTATQIPVMPYVLLFLLVLILNPFCRLIRVIRRFSRAEVLIIFIMGLVSSGISTFGLSAQIVPVIGGLFNPSWNHEQSAWNRHVVPLLEENYFLAVDGISEAAGDYAEIVEDRRGLQTVLNLANRVFLMDERLRTVQDELDRHRERMEVETGPEMEIAEARLQAERQTAVDAAERARRDWHSLMDDNDQSLLTPAEAVSKYQPRMEVIEAELEERREKLRQLEEEAFAKVELFRRGLPADQRAIPGFVMQSGDTLSSYLARLRRTSAGHRAGRKLNQASEFLTREQYNEAQEALTSASQQLSRMHETMEIREELQETMAEEQALTDQLLELESESRELNVQLRQALRGEIRALESAISRKQREIERIRRNRDRLREQRRHLQRELALAEEVIPLADRVDVFRSRLSEGGEVSVEPEYLLEIAASLPALDGCWQRYTVGDIPWGQWWGPLWRWGLLVGLSYVVLMTFNVLIFRQWAYHEKLVYPLAELPEALAGKGDAGDGIIPLLFRTPIFWLGFAVSACFMGYNVLAHSDLIPGLSTFDFHNFWDPYIQNTAFEGLLGGNFQRSHIFFTMIGLAFLIPAKVSFSLWFFAVLSMVQVLFLVWLGYGSSEASFPSEWWYTLNFRTAEGAGALIVFSSVVLFKCRHYLFCALIPERVRNLEADEQREMRWSSMLFIFASLGVIMMLWRGMGASLFFTLFTFLFILIITVGLIRAVAEGGLLGFQAWVNPFHLIRSFFGMDKAWTGAPLFAPLMVYYSILFLDIKTFIAPAMANSIKIRDDMRMRRGVFHLSIFAAILVAGVVAVIVSLMMAYSEGADVMSTWFYTRFPQQLFERLASIQQEPPLSTPAEAMWVVFGGLAMAGLLYFRQWLFWLPHPIGMIMLVNPLMGAYWFSILLGWLAKSLVTKYGNKSTYGHARTMFIGLIVGELSIVVLAVLMTAYTGTRIPIDLNRN